jgi:histone H4
VIVEGRGGEGGGRCGGKERGLAKGRRRTKVWVGVNNQEVKYRSNGQGGENRLSGACDLSKRGNKTTFHVVNACHRRLLVETTVTHQMAKGKRSADVKGSQKRQKKVLRDNICGITRGSIRRMARRGGVKRMSSKIFEGVRRVLNTYVEDVVRYSTAYAQYARKDTVTASDVVNALLKRGHILYAHVNPIQFSEVQKQTNKQKKN